MTPTEWESLCDGCGKCCLVRMEDEETQEIYVTDVHCKLFDPQTCRCKFYEARTTIVSDCVKLTRENVNLLNWMPKTCAYRLVAEGKPLPPWHHLISGSRETIHAQGMSVRNKTVHEDQIKEDDLVYRITVWPGEPDTNIKAKTEKKAQALPSET